MEGGSEVDEANKTAGEMKFTLKQLIRKLHIVEPVENVMCLLGKRYVVWFIVRWVNQELFGAEVEIGLKQIEVSC